MKGPDLFGILAEIVRLTPIIIVPSKEDVLKSYTQDLKEWREELEKEPKPKESEINEAVRKVKEVEDIEDVDSSIKHLIKSAKLFQCPVCRAIHYYMIEYLLEYDYKTSLIEEGYTDTYEEEYRKRYKPIVKERLNKISSELSLDSWTLNKSKSKFGEIALKGM